MPRTEALQSILVEVGLAFGPLRKLNSPARAAAFFRQLGYDLPPGAFGGALPVLVTLINAESFTAGLGDALIIAAAYLAVVAVAEYVAVPYVLGRSLDLNGTTVLIACLFWGFLWGLVGLVLVLVMGSTINGSRSWVHIAGMSIQSHFQPAKRPANARLSTCLFQSVTGTVSEGHESSAIQLMRARPSRRNGSEIG